LRNAGDDYWETVSSLIDCVCELKAEPGNQEILDEALGAAEGARTLAYDMPD
jgi:hypothetical protein